MPKLIGWDIGGAHLKAALLSEDGQVLRIQQLPCALWLGFDHLEKAMQAFLDNFQIKPSQVSHIVTMTGELVDLFANRHDGVVQISQFSKKWLGADILFYCMDKTITGSAFLTFSEVQKHSKVVASANWHASASLLAKYQTSALLIDIGSTTTDIITIENNRVVSHGLTDADRLQQDTLVYTGVVRTPVMATAQKIILNGQETNVVAEYFATMGDVYRLTGELMPDADMSDTADGQAKTLQASAKRLARMVGLDVDDKPMAYWNQLARTCREKQAKQIRLAASKHLKRNAIIVGAGVGQFLVKEIAHQLGQPYAELASILAVDIKHNFSAHLPAYAVAKLALLEGAI